MRKSDRRQITLGEMIDSGAASLQTGPFGSQLHASDYVPIGIPVIPTEAIGRRSIISGTLPQVSEETALRLSRHVLCPEDILFARRGVQATGLSAIVSERYAGALCSTGAIRLRLSTTYLDPQFLSFWLSSRRSIEWIKAHAVGGVMPNVNESVLRLLPIEFPEIREQRAIATFLGAIDEKIELNSEVNRKLEHLATTLFRSWFVDFDPVAARHDGNKTVGVPADAIDFFPSHFEESLLGPIPLGWCVETLASFTQTQYGYTASATSQPVGPHLLRITDMNKEPWIDWPGVPFCQADDAVKERYGLRVGDILVSRMADPGKAGIVEESVDAVFASYLVRLDAAPSRRYWLYYFLRSDEYLEYAEGAQGGTVQSNMNAQVIVAARAAVPPEELSLAFDGVVRPLRAQIVANLSESRALAELRDRVLVSLLSGELTMKLAEKAVGTAL